MKAGDVCSYAYLGHYHSCLILQPLEFIKDDDLLVLVSMPCAECRYQIFEAFPDSVVLAGEEDGFGFAPLALAEVGGVRSEVEAMLRTRQGKRLVERGPVTVTYDSRGRPTVHKSAGYGAAPSDSHGSPDDAQEPLIIADDYGMPNERLLRYLSRGGTQLTRMLGAMRDAGRRRQADVLERMLNGESCLAEIGRELGMAESTARTHKQLGIQEALDWLLDDRARIEQGFEELKERV